MKRYSRTAQLIYGQITNCGIETDGTLITSNSNNMMLAQIEQGKTYVLNQIAYAGFFYTEPINGDKSYDNTRTLIREAFAAPITGYIAIRLAHSSSDLMFNEGSTSLPYAPYMDWKTKSPPNYGTGTDTVTSLPVTLYTDGQPIAANLSSLNEANDTITNSYFKNNKLTIIPVTAGTYTISFYLAEKTSGILNGSIGIGTSTDYAYDIDNYPTPDNTPYTITRTFTITQSQIDTYGGYIWARFLRYNTRTDFSYKVTQIMLNAGSTALPYQPYAPWVMKGNTETSGISSPSSPITIDGVGNKTINLFNKNDSDILIGYEISSSGIVENSDWFVSGYIPVEYGVTYYKNNNSGGRLLLYDSSKTELGSELFYSNNSYTVNNNNVKYIRINNYIGTINAYMLNNISASEPYEPYGMYKVSITSNGTALTPVYLSQQLINLETVEIADTLASSGTAIYNTYKLVLTGDEAWYDDALPKGDTYSYRMIAPYIYDVGNVVGYDAICTHFAVGAYYAASVVGLQHSSRNLYFRNTQTTLANWKQWLADQYAAGTPVTVYYRVATSTTETVTAPSIPTTGNTATIDVDTTVKPSEMDLTYHGWHEHEPKKFVKDNLSPITAFTNTTTDSRQFIRPRIQTKLNSVEQQFITFADISATGTISLTVNITKDNDTLSFIHSGAQANITIFSISGGVPQGTYTLSFDVQGYDCSTVGGVVLSNIELKDSNGGHWE